MRKGLIIVFILVTITFGNVLGQITGNYKSAKYNIFERGILYLKGVKTFIGGTNLTLKSDSSFSMISCSVIETGKWTIINDSLHLEIKTKTLRNDSNSRKKEAKWMKKPFRPIIYKIIENGFYREVYLKIKNKKIKSADKLIKTGVIDKKEAENR